MFPNRRLSLTLMMLVCSSTALASAYEIDRPESRLPLSSPYSPLLFSTLVSNLADHVRLGNDQVSARSPQLRFDLASLASPEEAINADTMLTLPGASCRAQASHAWRRAQENQQSIAQNFGIRSSDAWEPVLTVIDDLGPSPTSRKLTPTAHRRPATALVVDEFPCIEIRSLHSLSTPFRSSLFTPNSIRILTQRDAFGERTK
jgi:hypothetical protein